MNDAGTGMCGRLEDIPVDAMRELCEVDVWGAVMGSQEALRHQRVRGGVLIDIGSVESDRATGVQGPYSASKHGVKAFTDEFRVGTEGARARGRDAGEAGAIDTLDVLMSEEVFVHRRPGPDGRRARCPDI